MADAVSIKLPRPHKAQQKVLKERKRHNVISAGRRFGKTEFGKIISCGDGGVLDGLPFGWFAPNNKYLLDAWTSMKDMFKPIAKKISEQHHRITLVNDATIDFWTLDDPDAGRSRKYGRVVIDEAAKVKDLKYSWENAIKPTLADYRGDSYFLSSPKGFDFFRDLYLRGQSDEEKFDDWASWIIPTSANPYIHPEEITEAKNELPEIVFRQEYLGEFVDGGGTPVSSQYIQYGMPDESHIVFKAVGVDLAITQKSYSDFTALACVALTRSGDIFIMEVQRGHWSFAELLQKIQAFSMRHNPNVVAVESVQFQQAVVQELLRTTTLPVRPFNPNKFGDKMTRFLPLAARYENAMVYHGDRIDPNFEDELVSFPVGRNDDMVDAVSSAYLQLPRIKGQGASAFASGEEIISRPTLAKKGFRYAY